MESLELHLIGQSIFEAFSSLQSSGHRRITSEEQRFRLWAHSLGLHQQGHASLDYRLQDSTAVRALVVEILNELKSHLDNIYAIWTNERLPFESDVDLDKDQDYECSSEDGSAKSTASSSKASFHEIDFRIQSVSEALDALYTLAAKIRSPRYRPQRTTEELYKHVPASIREIFQKDREEAEIAIVAYIQRQQLLEGLYPSADAGTLAVNTDEVIQEYASPENWLVRRTGIANARRRQQFVYWQEHADRIARVPVKEAPIAPVEEPLGAGQATLKPQLWTDTIGDGIDRTASQLSKSLATSATKLDETFVKLDDLRSLISHETSISTLVDFQGKKLEWPVPPKLAEGTKFFTCPYCRTLCPQRYLSSDAWRIHLIHDLQPYHCTYNDCHDPNRTYGTRQDWIDHENLHLRVWHCQLHGLEFETQPAYVNHLQHTHPDIAPEQLVSPELIASVVGPSLKPHRNCPLCPTIFTDIPEMQKHMGFHLERLAICVLPRADQEYDQRVSGHSSDSNNVERCGRNNSIIEDFSLEQQTEFGEFILPQIHSPSQPQDWSRFGTTQSYMSPFQLGERIKEWLNPSQSPEDLTESSHPADNIATQIDGSVLQQTGTSHTTRSHLDDATNTLTRPIVPPSTSSFADEQDSLANFQPEEGSSPPKIIDTEPIPQMAGTEDIPKFLLLDYENELLWDTRTSIPRIKGGSLLALVEQLTRHDRLDSNFNNTFLLTYRCFTSAPELFDLLVYRFTMQPPEGLTEEDIQVWSARKSRLVQFRVVNILRTWFDKFWAEEDNNHESRQLLTDAHTFARDTVNSTGTPGGRSLLVALEQRLSGRETHQQTMVQSSNQIKPAPILPKDMKKIKFLDIDIIEFARQLTILDSLIYNRIKAKECLHKAWQKDVAEDEPHQAANVKALILQSNRITNWVVAMILAQSEIKKRVVVIKRFTYIAEQCRILHNFSTLTSIISAMGTAPITRLRRTWDQVPQRMHSKLESMRKLMASTGNFRDYREALSRANPPCLPFFGVYLTDLTFIEDGIPSTIKKTNFINFYKWTKVAEVIRDIQQYQYVAYTLEPVPELQDYIESNLVAAVDVHDMYETSVKVEPN